jgi:hypothetical protein
MVFSEIENINDYLEYLDGKLKTIANSDSSVVVELGTFRHIYYMVLNQTENRINNKATFLIEYEDGKILRADTCIIPEPESIKMFGI